MVLEFTVGINVAGKASERDDATSEAITSSKRVDCRQG
jgi:hypothetical protein